MKRYETTIDLLFKSRYYLDKARKLWLIYEQTGNPIFDAAGHYAMRRLRDVSAKLARRESN